MAGINDPRPLTRKELAEFLPNQRAIRAFEKLFELIPEDIINLLNRIEETNLTASLADSLSNAAYDYTAEIDASKRNIYQVSKLRHLPSQNSGIIELGDYETFHFANEIDLEGLRIVCGQSTVIQGSNQENCRIKSTGLSGEALISSNYTLPLNHIALEAETIFNLDATLNPNQALDWGYVNFHGSSDIGLIKNYSNMICNVLGFLGTSGMVLDGTFGTVAFTDTIFSGAEPNTILEIPSTATITRRLRISFSSFFVPSGGIGLDVSTSASVPVEGHILFYNNFSGPGTRVAGIPYDDNKARWDENRGIRNSSSVSGYYMNNNATPTVVLNTSDTYHVEGITTETTVSQRWLVSATNSAEYLSNIERDWKVTITFSLTSGTGNNIECYIAINGVVIPESLKPVSTNAAGRVESGVVVAMTNQIVQGSIISMRVRNTSAISNITVTDMYVTIEDLK